jgi:GntR family colanic acid and biofilm gene transcriptional regulator
MTKKIDLKYQNSIKNTSSLTDVSYNAIRDAIVTGRFAPGEKLLQNDLANELSVSPRTVREALSRLVAEGFADYEMHRGFVTAHLSYENQEDIFRMRAALEGLALEYAVNNLTAEELARMRKLLPLTAATDDLSMIPIIREYNHEFHWIPINASKRSKLIQTIEYLWKFMFIYYLEYELNEDQKKEDFLEHEEILKALEAKNYILARTWWEKHLQSNLNILKQKANS